MKKYIYLFVFTLFCFIISSVNAQTLNYKEYTYKLFVSGNVSKWSAYISKFEKDPAKKDDISQIELLGYYYGYIGHLIDIKDEDRAEIYIKKALPLVEKLIEKYPNNALLKGYNANIIGFRIALSPLRATTLARGMMKNAKASISLAPNDPTVNILSANIFYYMPDFLGGNTKQALTQYKKALSEFEKNDNLRDNNWMYLQLMVTTAMVEEKLDNYNNAKILYEKILELYPNYPHVRDYRYPNLLKKMK